MKIIILFWIFHITLSFQGYFSKLYPTDSCVSEDLIGVVDNSMLLDCNHVTRVKYVCSEVEGEAYRREYDNDDCDEPYTSQQIIDLVECKAAGNQFSRRTCVFDGILIFLNFKKIETAPKFVKEEYFSTTTETCAIDDLVIAVYGKLDQCMYMEIHDDVVLNPYPRYVRHSTAGSSITKQSFANNCIVQQHTVSSAPDACTTDPDSGYDLKQSLYGQYLCYGNPADSSLVCSGHGDCVYNDDCQCDTNYGTAIDCSSWNCYGTLNDNDEVCNNHGTCIDIDNCECEESYGGDQCLSFYCSNVISTSSSVCSGHGICESADVCFCSKFYKLILKILGDGWTGVNCDIAPPTPSWVIALVVVLVLGLIVVIVIVIIVIIVAIVIAMKSKKEEIRLETKVKSRRLLDNQVKVLRQSLAAEEFKKINGSKVAELQKHFNSLDSDWDGMLSKKELKEGYRRVDKKISNKELNEIVDEIFMEADENSDGKINFAEFYSWMTRLEDDDRDDDEDLDKIDTSKMSAKERKEIEELKEFENSRKGDNFE